MTCLVVKLGSSLVVDESGTVRSDVLGRVCDEVAELHRAGQAVIVEPGSQRRDRVIDEHAWLLCPGRSEAD